MPLTFRSFGDDPTVGLFGRLRIMHYWLYPQALRRAAAVLDTFPYGGCLTVLEVSVFCTPRSATRSIPENKDHRATVLFANTTADAAEIAGHDRCNEAPTLTKNVSRGVGDNPTATLDVAYQPFHLSAPF